MHLRQCSDPSALCPDPAPSSKSTPDRLTAEPQNNTRLRTQETKSRRWADLRRGCLQGVGGGFGDGVVVSTVGGRVSEKKSLGYSVSLEVGENWVDKRDCESLADFIAYTLLHIRKPGNKGKSFSVISLFSCAFCSFVPQV